MTMFAGVALVGTAGHHELLAHRRGCVPPEGSAGSDLSMFNSVSYTSTPVVLTAIAGIAHQ
jgi:hypothetical protein